MAVADHWFSSNPPTRDTGGLAANGIAGATPLVGDDDVYMICLFFVDCTGPGTVFTHTCIIDSFECIQIPNLQESQNGCHT